MDLYSFYKNIRLSNKKNINTLFSKLKSIYKKIPETTGCLDNINKKRGCQGWCCFLQSPQLLYVEFLLIWDYISKNWSNEEICDLFEKCMVNVVNRVPSKGCVFFDKEKYLCKCHEVRPLNCRIYGITPKEEFNKRYEQLKEEYKGCVGAILRPQCDLISTSNGEEVTTEYTDKWWKLINKVEEQLGIPKKNINDEDGGSYRSPHDHVLLYNMPENVLDGLMGIRNYDSYDEKIKAIGNIVDVLRGHFAEVQK